MFRTLPIRVRLNISGAIAIVAVVVTAGVGLYGLVSGDQGLERQVIATKAIHHEMMGDMMHEGVEADVIHAVLLGPQALPEEHDALVAKVANDISVFRNSIAKLNELDLPVEVRGQVAAVIPIMEDYLTAGDATVKQAFQDQAAAQAALPGFLAKFNTLEAQMGRLGDLIQALGQETSQSAQQLDMLLIYILLAVSVATTLAMIYSAWYVTRSISKPIERLRGALRDVAQGDLGIRIGEITRDDDIGAIARDIDVVSERVKEAMDLQMALRAEG
ncbi:MAG: hypothetical protein B7Y02_14690, partial [Rhodobacterales bacterium 17-64-5]